MAKIVKQKPIELELFSDVEHQTTSATATAKKISSIVACKTKEKPQSAEQKKFATLSKKIEKLKKELKEIPQKEQEIRQFYSEKIEPELKEYSIRMKKNLKELDRWYEEGKLAARRRELVSANIIEFSQELLSLDIEDEESIELLNNYCYKHTEKQTGLTVEEQKQAEREEIATMVEELFGIEMDEKMKNTDNLQELFQQLQEKMKEQALNEGAFGREKEEDTPKTKKTTKKELEKQLREQQEMKSLRNIYIELVNEFHPDKEQDEAVKLKKEEQFKKITEAYRNKDIFALLTMQLNWIEESELALENQPNDILKQYNKLMKKQLDQLQNQLEEQANRPLWGLPMEYSGLLLESGYRLKLRLKELEDEAACRLFDVYEMERALKQKKTLNSFLDEKEKWNKEESFEDLLEFILGDLDDFTQQKPPKSSKDWPF